MEHEAEVNAMVAAWTIKHDKHEAMRINGGAGILRPVRAFDTAELLLNDPTSRATRSRRASTCTHPVIGTYKMTSWPARFSGRPPTLRPAPLLGQNNEDVLESWLDMSRDDIGTLKTDGII